ncbi:MAG: hypothetical protein ACRC8Q_12135 [Aeromonas sp.]
MSDVDVPARTVRARNSGHKPLNDLVRKDWAAYVTAAPDSFDAIIILPESAGEEEQEGADDDGALFGRVDQAQQVITYGAIELVRVLVAPIDDLSYLGAWDGDDGLGMGASAGLNLLLSCGIAPVGSILEWEEEISTGELRRAWWYVHSTQVVGTAAVGAVHVCIPCGDLEQARAIAAKAALDDTDE